MKHVSTDNGHDGNPGRLTGNAMYTWEAEERARQTVDIRKARSYDEYRDRLQQARADAQIAKEYGQGL